MPARIPALLRAAALAGAALIGPPLAPAARAAVTLAELHAAPSERFLRWDTHGTPRLGAGPAWFDPDFADDSWASGPAPLGFGFGALGTDLGDALSGRTPSLYLRRHFQVATDTAARPEPLRLRVTYNDGFVAFLNGREVARARLGPPGMFIYADATAFSVQTNTGVETFDLGPAAALLRPGDNVLALQVQNQSIDAKGNLRIDAALEFAGGAFTTTHLAEDFNNANGAARTHTNAGGLIQNTSSGTPPPASWLATAPNPSSSPAWTSFSVVQTLATNGGAGDSGHLHLRLAGAGPTQPALIYGPGVVMTPSWSAGTVTDEQLSQTVLDLRYLAPPGFRIDLVAEPLSGDRTRVLELGSLPPAFGAPGPTLETIGWWRFDDAAAVAGGAIPNAPSVANPGALTAVVAGGTPRWTADVPGPRILDPISGTLYENRFALDASAPLSRFNVTNLARLDTTNGSFTLEFFLKLTGEPPGYDPFARRTVGAGSAASSTLRRWQIDIDRSATRGSFGRVRSRWDTPGVPPPDYNRVLYGDRIYVDTATGSGNPSDYPADGTVTDYGTFGDNTNDAATARWYHVALTVDGPARRATIFHDYTPGGTLVLNTNYLHPAAVLELGKMSSSNYAVAFDEIRYSSRVLASSEMLRVIPADPGGFHTNLVRLGDAPAAQRAAFLSALNAAGGQGFRPALRVRDESVGAAPGRELRLDDVRVTYQRQATFFPLGTTFRYRPGRAEPSGGVFEPNLPPEPNNPYDQASVPPFPDLPGFADWIELHNDGPDPVLLDGWSLTDSSDKDQWRFPTNTVLAPDGRLLVLCDERTDLTNAACLHANFKLSEGGERVRLYSNGVLQADVDYPRQDHFRSYGLLPGTTNYAYLELPSPGAPNAGPASAFRCRTPDFSVPGGFYTGSLTLVITSATVTAGIRYTLDGSEPTPASLLYSAPLTLMASTNDRSGTIVRARAFQAGAVPSGTRSATYLLNQNPALTNLPALCLTAEAGRNLFKDFGILAIGGGYFTTNTTWAATNIADYNVPLMHGRPYERPVFVEWHRADGRPGFAEEAGLRLAGSPHARPRYKLTQTGLSPWPANFTEKPSFNLFWREDYDQAELNYPFLGQDYPVKTFDQLRPRAGKNDVSNPFIKDELVRRVFSDMGHATVRGNLNTLYLNGSYKGFYNTVERYRTSFFQAHYGSSAEWDIRINDGLEEGDTTEWTNLLAVLNTDLNVRTNYDRAMAGLVLDEVIDYFLINLYVGMWDWPGNNWVAARERTPQGRFRLHLWDAEGSFGQGGLKPPSYDHITTDLRNGTASLPTLFKNLFGDGSTSNQALKAETRLRFADRIHRHFFHGGALDDRVPTNTVWARRLAELGAAFAPVLQYTHGTAWSTAFWTNWTTATTANWTFNGVANTPLPRRRAFLFGPVAVSPPGGTATNVDLSFRRHGLWPATEPPALSQHGGAIPPGTPVSLATNGTAPAGSLVFYTLDGSDPRAFGGSPSPSALAYTGPFTLPGPVQTTVKARVQNSVTGEWSPLTEALFILNASQPAPGDLVLSHLHYQPADANVLEQAAGFTDRDRFEFLELMNISPRVVDLQDINFTAGISFIDWTASPVQALAPGDTVLLVKNLTAFRTRYGTHWNPRLAGEYLGQLDNSGERLLLVRGEGATGVILRDFYYWDQPPWPNSADGNGASLVLRQPATNPDHNLAENWDGSGGWTAPTNTLPWLVGWLAWRNKYFLTADQLTNAAISGPAADPDADGLNNEQEFQADTHPLDPASGLLPALGLTATNSSLTFRAKAYRTYTLESRAQVHTGSWVVYTNFPATPTNRWETLLGPLPPAGTNRFFRLRLP